MDTIATKFSHYAQNLRYSDLPWDVRQNIKYKMLDYVGVVMAARYEKSTLALEDFMDKIKGSPESTAIGFPIRIPAIWAAFLNGVMGHSMELDDHHSHTRSLNHPGVVSHSAALAMSEKMGVSGKDYMVSAVLGYELSCRLERSTPFAWFNHKRYFHSTGVCGVFGAAITAARLLGLSIPQMVNALGIAGSMASGLMEYKTDGSWTKRIHPGWAAHSGLMASMLAQSGFSGPSTVFEGPFGFFSAYAGERVCDYGAITKDLGKEYEISYVLFKPYACGGMLHSAISAVDGLVKSYTINPEDIASIIIKTSKKIVDNYGDAAKHRLRPRTKVDAQFSVPFVVASMICDGQVLIKQFTDEKIQDPRTLTVASKVKCVVAPEIDANWPDVDRTDVEMYLKDGRVYKYGVKQPKGELSNPLTEEEVIEKFYHLTKHILSHKQAEAVLGVILSLEDLEDLRVLGGLLQGR